MKSSRYDVTVNDPDTEQFVFVDTLTGAIVPCDVGAAVKAEAMLAAPDDGAAAKRGLRPCSVSGSSFPTTWTSWKSWRTENGWARPTPTEWS